MVEILVTFVDPPSGWMYGFPKVAPSKNLTPTELIDWFLNNGYPQELIDKGMLNHCRYIYDYLEENEDKPR